MSFKGNKRVKDVELYSFFIYANVQIMITIEHVQQLLLILGSWIQ